MNLEPLHLLGIAYVVSEWIIRLVMLIVVPFRRSPDAAKGWLLLILFLPWPGLLLYWFVGRPTFPRWRAERFARVPGLFAAILKHFGPAVERFRPTPPPALEPVTHLVKNLGQFGLLGDNAVELLPHYDSSIDRLAADIDAAQHHVHLLYYIFADDAAGTKVIDALARATARGVRCRVIVDALGSKRWARSLQKRLTSAGVAFCRALPVHLLRRGSARADLRNHRKIAVLDGRVGFTGSQNIVDADFKPGVVNEEMVVRATGPVVLQLQAVFISDWFMETGEALEDPVHYPPPEPTGPALAQVLPSGPDYATTNVQRLVIALLHQARKRAVITTPYFIPDDAFVEAMQTAVLRGVAVHLVVSRQADQLLVSLAQRSFYAAVLQAGVHIHLYRDRFLHAKHLSFDDEICLIGSSNMDLRSFQLDLEVSLLVYDRDVAARLAHEQERYIAASDRLTLEEWQKRSPPIKVCENLARMMSPLL